MAKVEEKQKTVKKTSRPKKAEEEPVSEDYAERKAEIKSEIESLRAEIESLKSAPTEIESLGRRIAEMAGEIENIRNEIRGFAAPAGIDESGIERKISVVRNEIEKKIELLESKEKLDAEKISKNIIGTKALEDKLKLFALNADMESLWKDVENFKREVSDKINSTGSILESVKRLEQKNFEFETNLKNINSEINHKIDSAKNVADNLQKRIESLEGKEKADVERIAKEVLKGGDVEEKLKMFALNADLDKLWKEMEDYRKQIDERARAADRLADALNKWEQRAAATEEKARQLDEKIAALPELALMEDQIKRIEKELNTIKKYFVVAKVTQPVILE